VCGQAGGEHCTKVTRDVGEWQDDREQKRQRRKQSNRESARRSRLRKQAECEQLSEKVTTLETENAALKEENRLLREHLARTGILVLTGQVLMPLFPALPHRGVATAIPTSRRRSAMMVVQCKPMSITVVCTDAHLDVEDGSLELILFSVCADNM
jgi:uncharacterized membrane protein YdbT with pleckstrin-like domain